MSRHFARARLVVLLASVAACDIPTELPKWDTTFVVQAQNTKLTVAQLLPSSVALANSGTAFTLSLSPSTFTRSLGALCPACVNYNGMTVPKPAFTQTLSTSMQLPADVKAATLVSGAVNVSVSHGFSFDPLRPAPGTYGTMSIAVRSGSTVLGSATVNGSETSFAPGSTITVAVPLAAATVAGAIDVDVNLNSPAGSPVAIDTNAQITMRATPSAITVASAQVSVTNRQITAAPVQLDLANIDSFIIDQAQRGALMLSIDNPFAVTGKLVLTLSGGATPISKSISLEPGQSNIEVAFDASEVRALLGRAIAVSLTGPVTAANPVEVRPELAVSVNAKFKLILGPES